eukprot:COSAG01_NODE_560_length_15462_cov_18.361192_3_plen_642_part_00
MPAARQARAHGPSRNQPATARQFSSKRSDQRAQGGAFRHGTFRDAKLALDAGPSQPFSQQSRPPARLWGKAGVKLAPRCGLAVLAAPAAACGRWGIVHATLAPLWSATRRGAGTTTPRGPLQVAMKILPLLIPQILAAVPELRDRSGMPLIPMGSYSAEPVSARHSGIREFKTGANTHLPLLPWENPSSCPASEWDGTYCGNSVRRDPLPEVHAWLDRADAVGVNVIYNLESIARATADGVPGSGLRNASCCPLQWKLIASEVREVMHHPSIVAWYIADEPDSGRVPDADRVAVVAKVRQVVRANDAKQRPTVACFDTTPAYYHGAHNWPDFLDAVDIVAADIYEDDPGGGALVIGEGPAKHTEEVYSWAVAEAIDQLVNASGGKRVFLVPRIFSGRECYSATVSPSSIRGQTYLAFIHGATGIMSFVHTGVTRESRFHADADSRGESLVSYCRGYMARTRGDTILIAPALLLSGRNPASFNVYAEYIRLSLEFESITSALLAPKPSSWRVVETSVGAHHVHAALPIVHAAVFEDPARPLPAAAGAGSATRGSLVVLAMNTQRAPTAMVLTLESADPDAAHAPHAPQHRAHRPLSNSTLALAMFEGGGTAWDYAHPKGPPGADAVTRTGAGGDDGIDHHKN